MGLLTRAHQKIFGSTGGTSEFAKIGSKTAGLPVTTKDLELIQSLSQYLLGMNAIVSDQGTSVLPYLEDINSLFFLSTSQLAYIMQAGVPEWDDATEYYQEVSFAVDGGKIYKSLYGSGVTPNLNFQPSANLDKWQQVTGLGKVDFESKDLIINVQTTKTVKAWLTRLSLLDSNYHPKYLNNTELTWDITAGLNLEPGTSEIPGATYGLWVDEEEIVVLAPDLESVTNSTTAFKLKDSFAAFLTNLVHEGDIVYNLDTKQKTTVSADATLEGEVYLVDDIFTSSPENYKIVKMSPVGLSENRERIGSADYSLGSAFDNSHYTQIQEEKFYGGNDFAITGTPAISSVYARTLGVRQQNDWTGFGIWRVESNIAVAVASASRTSAFISLSGVVFKNTANFFQPGVCVTDAGAASTGDCTVAPGTGDVSVIHPNSVTASYRYSFSVLVDKKPTFHL